METRLPWRPTRGSLTSPSYLVRKRTLGPPLENNPKTPPSSRDEGLRLLHGLETNLAASLQTPQGLKWTLQETPRSAMRYMISRRSSGEMPGTRVIYRWPEER